MAGACQAIEPLLAAYALGALEPDERVAVEQHLDSCDTCPPLLADYRSVAQAMLMLTPRVEPPTGLRRGLETAIGRPRAGHGIEVRRGWPRPLGWGLAASLAVMIALNLFLVQQITALRRDQGRLSEQIGGIQMAQAIGTYPGSESLTFEDGDAYGTFVYNPERPMAAMYAWGLPRLPAGQIYQVWLRTADDRRVSGGMFQAQGGKAFTIVVIHSPQPMGEFAGFGVTIEPAGGSQAPTRPPILASDF